MPEINVAIIGATGFTGSELVRILNNHPHVKITLITSESRTGEKFSDVHPFFRGIVDSELRSIDDVEGHKIDVAFLALPHGVSMEHAEKLYGYDFPVIDLSGDFRLSDPSVYKEWYGKEHSWHEGFAKAVYGLPEIHKEAIKKTKLTANPGCYPTSVILGVAPLIAEGLVDTSRIIADSKSGVTGAGVKAKAVNHYSNVNENFKAYGLKEHRHTIEIIEQLSELAGADVSLQFTPHLLPVDRGILSTIYMQPIGSAPDMKKLNETYNDHFGKAPFIRLTDTPPAIKEVRGTNYCDIFFTYDEKTNNIIVVSVIDNLVKGASGQAVQNMNLMFGFKETSGLDIVPLHP